MRIIQLTPGTGNFYCGSCLRDNALVRGLRARGHDALMVPLYLPIVVDEPSASEGVPIFLSGLSVYLSRKFNVPAWLDRALSSPALLRMVARLANLTTAKDLGESAVAMLHGAHTPELDRLLAWLHSQPAPDIICLSNSLLSGLARHLKELFHVPVVSSFQGEDGFLDALTEPYRTDAWRLLAERCRDVDHFIAPSRYHADQMQSRLALPAENVSVVHNGIALEGYEPAAPPATPTIGFFARMHHAKGLDTLVEAFLKLKTPNARLRIAGTMTSADKPFVEGLRRKLGDHAEFLPNLDRAAKQEFLRNLSVFSVPAQPGEAFGMYVLEALAAGVPVVQPRHSAFPELLTATGGGILCEQDSLASALDELLADPARARQLGEAGRQVVCEKFSVEAMSANVETVLQKVIHAG